VRRPGNDDVAVFQEQAGPLVFLARVESDHAAVAVGGGARNRRLNADRAAELLGRR
jgi:hypothetical protein